MSADSAKLQRERFYKDIKMPDPRKLSINNVKIDEQVPNNEEIFYPYIKNRTINIEKLIRQQKRSKKKEKKKINDYYGEDDDDYIVSRTSVNSDSSS